MEQLVDSAYYTGVFVGTKIPVGEIDRELQIAQLQLNGLTRQRINTDLVEPVLSKVKVAICHQAEYHYQNGGDMGGISGFSIDGISVSYTEGSFIKHISETSHLILKTTGLLSRIL